MDFHNISILLSWLIPTYLHLYTIVLSNRLLIQDCQRVVEYVLIENARYGPIMLRWTKV